MDSNLNEDLLQLKIDTENNDVSGDKHALNSLEKPIGDLIPDLEYEEEFAALVTTDEDSKLGTGQFTAENYIEEDFDAELGAQVNMQPILDSDIEDKNKTELKERIDSFGIVNVSGSDLTGRPIIILAASKLPDAEAILKETKYFKSHQHFFELLLEFLSNILERYVESEYTLVYLHYGLKSTSQPSFNWLGKVYKMLDRKFKKNLKALYIVHPTILFKVLWQVIKPLISSKFIKKITYCNTLKDLSNFLDLNNLNIPEEVKLYDIQIKPKKQNESSNAVNTPIIYGQYQQFKAPLEHIEKNSGDCIPLCVKETVIFLRKNLDEEGLFRKSGSLERIKQIQKLYNEGQPVAYDTHECHVAACILKAFFRELPESLLSESIFNEMMSLQALDIADKVEVSRDLLRAKLPTHNYKLLNYLISFLNEVAQHSLQNKMDAKNLSYCFGPNFLRKTSDAEYTLIDIERINSFVELLIKYHSDIFSKENSI